MREIVNKLEAENTIISNIKGKKEDEFFHQYKEKMVISSKQNALDNTYCQKESLEVYNASNMGGTIVAHPGDIGIAFFKFDGWNMGKDFLAAIKQILSSKIENISFIGNDLLVDGIYKVGSFASINCGDKYIYTAAHLSFDPNIELIKNVCTKEMKKIPKGLKNYGYTTENLKEIVYEACSNLQS